MQDEHVDRRSFLKVMGAVGMSSTLLPEAAFGLHPASAPVMEQAAGAGRAAPARGPLVERCRRTMGAVRPLRDHDERVQRDRQRLREYPEPAGPGRFTDADGGARHRGDGVAQIAHSFPSRSLRYVLSAASAATKKD